MPPKPKLASPLNFLSSPPKPNAQALGLPLGLRSALVVLVLALALALAPALVPALAQAGQSAIDSLVVWLWRRWRRWW